VKFLIATKVSVGWQQASTNGLATYCASGSNCFQNECGASSMADANGAQFTLTFSPL